MKRKENIETHTHTHTYIYIYIYIYIRKCAATSARTCIITHFTRPARPQASALNPHFANNVVKPRTYMYIQVHTRVCTSYIYIYICTNGRVHVNIYLSIYIYV
ncbi:hypothetical protein, unlikely [Trypanosoma brucei gambiense DAL972]|uniref:Uncharacterized protein n=1 Tax=Trypanosoma brucei gambiense (strain MHOM/CI/86/DAL972) TaxID=679716 RepID=C9ZU22_TRYB9|nr:hypothetical protein, unlikely [Trypanosoma brucei gambiense DAL972]CBH12908.1 hypothetical protein, unlikely [Trypanosoma brucei gambiense DAL972]|eukprot:XP_011775187.1 hypothetical protein, unlikely [Trypanosoma brucei gambiense DAL972]